MSEYTEERSSRNPAIEEALDEFLAQYGTTVAVMMELRLAETEPVPPGLEDDPFSGRTPKAVAACVRMYALYEDSSLVDTLVASIARAIAPRPELELESLGQGNLLESA